MADKRDYYEVLGVSKNASDDEIKRAYRKKAKECHPDLHPNDEEAVKRFAELNEANEVLSDPQKRARYDQFGFEDPMAGMGGGGGNPFGGAGFDFGGMGDIFDQLFNGGMGGMGSRTRAQGPVQGNDLRYELRITFEEAAKGCEKSFEIYRNELCDTCKGNGAKPGTKPTTCAACHGATGNAAASLFLTEGKSRESLVGIQSKKVPTLNRVTPGDSPNSVLYQTISGDISSTWHYNHSAEITSADMKSLIADWIDNGAK